MLSTHNLAITCTDHCSTAVRQDQVLQKEPAEPSRASLRVQGRAADGAYVVDERRGARFTIDHAPGAPPGHLPGERPPTPEPKERHPKGVCLSSGWAGGCSTAEGDWVSLPALQTAQWNCCGRGYLVEALPVGVMAGFQ